MNAFHDLFLALLGADGQAKDFTFLQMGLRSLVIFFAGLALVRIGDRRSLSEKTAFDGIFLILLGSILSRAINGSAPFFVTIGAAILLMLVHRFFSFAAARSHKFGLIIKGTSYVLVRDGRIDRKMMARVLVSEHDLEEDLRLHAQTDDLAEIHLATLERSGDVSFVTKRS
jgi:uncharacterized membrane protein YcaP (DUF421 family)